MLHPWGTGRPYSGEARAEVDGYVGSLAGLQGALGHLSQTPGTQRVSRHVESGFRP